MAEYNPLIVPSYSPDYPCEKQGGGGGHILYVYIHNKEITRLATKPQHRGTKKYR